MLAWNQHQIIDYVKLIGLKAIIPLIIQLTPIQTQAHPRLPPIQQDISPQYPANTIPEDIPEPNLFTPHQTPIFLNSATREALLSLHILNHQQISNLLEHIKTYGPLVSINELQAIDQFDIETIRQLRPLVHVHDIYLATQGRKMNNHIGYILTRYQRTIESPKGYQPNVKHPYQGNPNDFTGKINITHPTGWWINYSNRKQAGEPPNNYYIGQHSRFYCSWEGKNMLRKIIVGDYEVGYGEGLLLNSGFSIDKLNIEHTIKTNNQGIRPNNALGTTAFQGIASTLGLQHWQLTTYHSRATLDATVHTKPDQHIQAIRRNCGPYRTKLDLKKRKTIREYINGITLAYHDPYSGISIGCNGIHNTYSLPINPNPKRSNPQRFRGDENYNGSIFGRFLWKNIYLFGEYGRSKSGGTGTISGAVASWTRYLDTAILWRHYEQNFHAPYGKAFRENASGNINEKGLYIGVGIHPHKKLHIDGYYDHFLFPWFSGKHNVPGHSWLIKCTYQPSKTSKIIASCKHKTKAKKVPREQRVENGAQYNFKLQMIYEVNKNLAAKIIGQYSKYTFNNTKTHGKAIAGYLAYKAYKNLQFKGQIVWFNCDNSANKLYFYENNVMHTGFNYRPYQGYGNTLLISTIYKPRNNWRLEANYAIHYMPNAKTIGTGNEQIDKNLKNKITVQAIYKF